MIEHFLTTEQVADILQVHPFTILRLIKNGKLKGVKLGRVYRIKESDVHAFLEQNATQKGTEKEKSPPEREKQKTEKKADYYIESEDAQGEDHYYII